MKILPQINYFFSLLAVIPTEKWFQSLNSSISQFFWKNKKAKIKYSTLQKNKLQGGLEAPNFLYYFLANQLQYIVKWLKPNNNNTSWIDLEQTYCPNLKLSDLPFLNTSL